jgi:hypothetical protein
MQFVGRHVCQQSTAAMVLDGWRSFIRQLLGVGLLVVSVVFIQGGNGWVRFG